MSRTRLDSNEWKLARKATLARDSGTCVTCGDPATEVDHLIPRYRGGTHELDNLQALCSTCHKTRTRMQAKQRAQQKRNRTPRPVRGSVPYEVLPPPRRADFLSPSGLVGREPQVWFPVGGS